MEKALIAILIILIGVIIFLLHKLSLQKHYYAYKSDLLDNMEESSSKKIQELEESVEHLNKAAYTDITTKIGNRDYFIKATLDILEREKEKEFTLITFEIANLVMVNRMFGHAEGDRLIRHVAQRLKVHAKGGSIYAIVQSNLFAIVLKTQEEEEILTWIKEMSEDIEGCTDLV